MKHKLHAICPYFAMFPESFVRMQVETHTRRGEWVFDPFCGRGTTILESLLLGRNAAGSDINPVAFCVSRAKAERPLLSTVKHRIDQLATSFARSSSSKLADKRRHLPAFFRRAFYPTTLNELLFLRSALDWRTRRSDRFITALILGSLHGETDRSSAYFSNQMPRTICLKPDYSLRYWHANELYPKKRKVFEMLHTKAEHRLSDFPECETGTARISDAREVAQRFPELKGTVSLVVTSPPYLNVTRYEEDQWLRLWFLGGEPRPTYNRVSRDDRYESVEKYWEFLEEAWRGIAPLMKPRGTLVVRLGAIAIAQREMTRQLLKGLGAAFPRGGLLKAPQRSEIVRRQAKSFLPTSRGCIYEVDYVFRVS